MGLIAGLSMAALLLFLRFRRLAARYVAQMRGGGRDDAFTLTPDSRRVPPGQAG